MEDGFKSSDVTIRKCRILAVCLLSQGKDLEAVYLIQERPPKSFFTVQDKNRVQPAESLTRQISLFSEVVFHDFAAKIRYLG